MDGKYVVMFRIKSEENPPVLTSPSHDWHIYFPTSEESVSLTALIRNLDRCAKQEQWQNYRLFRWNGALASQVCVS